MSNKTNHEIKCLSRLDELLSTNETIVEYLVSEGLMQKDEQKAMMAGSDVAKALQLFLGKMKGNKLQLLEYEWVLLPEERLKVTIISDRNSREFSYNY
jgi:hypothetical protein